MGESERIAPTERTRVRRVPQRATYERAVIYSILDEGLVAHVGFVDRGEPFVLPMAYVRIDDAVYLHGSTRARLLTGLGGGARVCLTVTLLDGLVLARSAFHHSMNYRSVTVLGRGRAVEEEADRNRVLAALVERIAPGRSALVRPPSSLELRATAIVAVPIEEAAAKRRSGPPLDDSEDLDWPVWAGVLPVALERGKPEPDPQLAPGMRVAAPATSRLVDPT